jgi:transposase InsO family protein
VRTLAQNLPTTYSTTKTWLSSQDAYTLHKPVRRIFPRRKTFAKGINDLFQADLVDMQKYSRSNDGYRYILTCVDVFSKRGFAIPLKDKRGLSIVDAFREIFNQHRPVMLQTDRGTEFLNTQVQELFKKLNIKHYWSLNDDIKAACVERFNRTLKTRMFRYFTARHTNRWVDVLQAMIESYNNKFHRSIGMTPNNVNVDNSQQVANKLYPEKTKPHWKYQVGDKVRISRYKHIFVKGFAQNWSDELFIISLRYNTSPVTYGLTDLAGEEIKGKFYESELQKVTKSDDVYIVEKVLKTRKRNGQIEHFVKWKGYTDKFNSWTTDVFKL